MREAILSCNGAGTRESAIRMLFIKRNGVICCGILHRSFLFVMRFIHAVRHALCPPGRFGKTLLEFCGSSFSMQDTRTLLLHLRCHSIPLHTDGGLSVFHRNSIILIPHCVYTKGSLSFDKELLACVDRKDALFSHSPQPVHWRYRSCRSILG